MGSRITRALSQTDRQRRVQAGSQEQAKQFIKAICTSMFGLLWFAMGFLTSHSTQAHITCLQSICSAVIVSIVMNASNPQVILISGWIMLTLQSLFFSSYARVLYSMGMLMVIYSSYTNIYNYYTSPSQPTFVKHRVPGALVLVGACVLRVAHCSSHYIKQLRAQTTRMNIQQQHNIGLRVLFCVMGLMVVMLQVMGHIYVRRHRFMGMGWQIQLKYLLNIKIVKMIQAVCLLVGLRSVMLSMQQVQACNNMRIPMVADLVLSIAVLIVSAMVTHSIISNTRSNGNRQLRCQNMLTLMVLSIYSMCLYVDVHIYIAYLISLYLSLLVILHLSTIINNQHRINYIIAIIVAIVCQANYMSHIHISQSSPQYTQGYSIIITICTISMGVLLPSAWRLVSNRLGGYTQVSTDATQASNLIQNHP